MTDILRDRELAAILQESANFGPDMFRKLQAHVAFMVENRRKYYAALHASLGRSEPA